MLGNFACFFCLLWVFFLKFFLVQFIKTFFGYEMAVFEEYGAFKYIYQKVKTGKLVVGQFILNIRLVLSKYIVNFTKNTSFQIY